jgi:hypothetical protein
MTIENENSRKDRKVDRSIDHTFPASDPTPPSRVTANEPGVRPVDRQAPIITKEQIDMAQRGEGHSHHDATMGSELADHPDQGSVDVRQGTGPRATVSVLLVSLLLAIGAGAVVFAYFYA